MEFRITDLFIYLFMYLLIHLLFLRKTLFFFLQKAGTSLIMSLSLAQNDVSSQGHANPAYVFDLDEINAKRTSPAPPSAHSIPRNLPAGNGLLHIINNSSHSDTPPPSEYSSSIDDTSEPGHIRVYNRIGSSGKVYIVNITFQNLIHHSESL